MNYIRAEKLSQRDFMSTGALEDASAKLGVAYAKKLLTHYIKNISKSHRIRHNCITKLSHTCEH